MTSPYGVLSPCPMISIWPSWPLAPLKMISGCWNSWPWTPSGAFFHLYLYFEQMRISFLPVIVLPLSFFPWTLSLLLICVWEWVGVLQQLFCWWCCHCFLFFKLLLPPFLVEFPFPLVLIFTAGAAKGSCLIQVYSLSGSFLLLRKRWEVSFSVKSTKVLKLPHIGSKQAITNYYHVSTLKGALFMSIYKHGASL